jgi:uncharacterized protein YhaN
MRIEEFHVDGFGRFCGLSLKQVPTGLSIVLGDNEAGKSTLLAFLRSILFGLPTRGQKQFYPPFNGGRKGGRLVLANRQQERIIVERCEGKGSGPLTVTFPDGRTVGEDAFRPLIGSATAELYENVFAFSLTELQQFESLGTENVRDAIYSAGIGAGRKTLTEISKGLKDRHEALFTPRGSKSVMNKLLASIEAAQKKLKEHRHDQDHYEQIRAELASTDTQVALLRTELEKARSEFKRVETLQQAWDDWNSLKSARLTLREIPQVKSFPTDGVKRLDELNLELRNYRDQLTEAVSDHKRWSLEFNGIQVNDSVEATRDDIRRLERGRELSEQALREIPEQKSSVDKAEKRLSDLLSELGDGWDESRVEQFSIPGRLKDQVEQYARDLNKAAEETRDLQTQLRAAQKELTSAEEELHEAKQQLEQMPELTDAELVVTTEQVVGGRDRYESQQLESSRLQSQLDNGKSGLQDTLQNIGADWDETRLRTADTSLAVHAEVEKKRQELADRRAEHQQEADRLEEIRRQVGVAKSDRAAAEESLAVLDQPGAVSEDVLLEKQRTMRTLRVRVTEVELRQEKRNHLTERIRELNGELERLSQSGNGSALPVPDWAIPAILSAGAGVCVALGLGRDDWISGGIVFAFSATLAVLPFLIRRSLNRAAELQAEHRLQTAADCESRLGEFRQSEAELTSQIETLQQAVSELAISAQLPEQVDSSRLDVRTLDEAEASVESALRLLQHRRPHEQKLAAADAKLQREESELSDAEELRSKKDERLSETRQEWSAWLEAAEFPQSMTPETAAGVLARLDTAREQLKSIDRDRGQLEELQQAMQKFELQSQNVAADWQQVTSSNDDTLRILDELKSQLGRHEIKVKAHEDAGRRVENAESLLAKKKKDFDAAAEVVRKGAEKETLLKQKWVELLKQVGIDETLNVETAQRVFPAVERTRDHLASVSEKRDRSCLMIRHAEGYRADVRGVAVSVGQPEPSDEEVSGVVAGLLALLEKEGKNRQERETLREKIAGADSRRSQLEQHIGSRQDQIAELLEAASASDEESFRTKASDQEARQTLQHQIQQAKMQLLKLVGDEEALKSLERDLQRYSLEELNQQQAELEERIGELEDKREKATTERGGLKEQLDRLENADELSSLRISEQSGLADFETAAGEWSVLKLAAHLIDRARVKYEKERRPAVLKEAEKYFARFTEGNYVEIRPSDDGSQVVVLTPDGQIKSADQLSRGTAEQLYLSLRFGFVNEFVTHSEPLPLVFDDILVNFDPRRARAAAEAILELAEAQQILFFTCQPSIADLFQQIDSEVSTFKVKDGRFV